MTGRLRQELAEAGLPLHDRSGPTDGSGGDAATLFASSTNLVRCQNGGALAATNVGYRKRLSIWSGDFGYPQVRPHTRGGRPRAMSADPTSSSECIAATVRSGVRVLTINRSEHMNSLSRALLDRLSEEFLLASEDPDVRVIVVTAVGDRAFSAGADLKELRDADSRRETFRGPMNKKERLLFEIVGETYKPTIAALNGAAIGGGLELALACDIRTAAAGIKLGFPEAKVGMGAVFGSVVLPRRIPLGRALELLFTGDYFTADEAERWGLINQVLPREELLPYTLSLAERIAQNAPISIRRMKEMALKGLELPLWSALRLGVGPDPYLAEDRAEGIRAFLDHRRPRWKGR